MHKTTWDQLDPKTRIELETLLGAPGDRFHSQYLDAVTWWLFLMIVCVGGAAAAIWNIATSYGTSLSDIGVLLREAPLRTVLWMLITPQYGGLLLALVIGPWVALTWIQNVGKRGVALTSEAIVLVRGKKLVVIPYAEIAGADRKQIRTKKQTFTVMTLRLKDGRTKDVYTNGGWAKNAMEKLVGA